MLNQVWVLDRDDRFVVKGAALAGGAALDFLREFLRPGMTAWVVDDGGVMWRVVKTLRARPEERRRASVELVCSGTLPGRRRGRHSRERHLTIPEMKAIMGCWSW